MTVRLADVAFLNPRLGETLPANTSISFVPMAAVSAEEARVTIAVDRPYTEVSKGYTSFHDGDVLVAKITPCFENGKIAQAVLPRPIGFGSTEFHVIRPKPGMADARYLHHFLRQTSVRIEGERRMTGSGGQRRVPESFLAQLEVRAPSLPEQRRIAGILDQADALRAKRREALAQLDGLAQAIFVEMFGKSLLAPSRATLGDFVQDFRYGTSEKSGASGYPALRIPNIASGRLDLRELKTVPVTPAEFDRLRLKDGDLLFVRTNGNPDQVGRCAVFETMLVEETIFEPSKFIYASYLIRARAKQDEILPVVLQQYLSDGEGRRALRARCKTSAGQYNINTESLRAIPVPIFPRADQQTFATRTQAVEALKTIHRAALVELDALFASLQQRAFSGLL